ncbi:DEP1 regulator of phospholipid metabolism [Fusarium albosuccineum]|uniref:DEP1 regulator of phospholipid metabolism n=1 Tax=Fusarium albosuccineum TaxID=1237068 RepID=A0A8H4PEV3_9HYPO|nr:DEP1 regulator of phospholipid metabolism [Fusarium albosuccineum]
MAATASVPPPLSSPAVGVADLEDSNISSPLSEVDTKDDNDEDIEHMQLDNDDEDSTKPSPKKKPHANSDSDSALSDTHTDDPSDGNDTEAETERLYDTPRHQRLRDVVVDQFNEGQIFEHTPSKLRRTANLDEHNDDDSVLGDDTSIGSPTIGRESPVKLATTEDANLEDEHKNDSQDRKRKRSPAADQSETEQPLRKRTSSVHAPDINTPQQAEDTVMHEDEPTPANESSGTQTPAEEVDVSPRKRSVAREDEVIERATRATKKSTRSGSKRKSAAPADADHDTDGGSHDGARDSARGTDVEHHEEAEADAEEEVDPATAHDEEMERKHAAYKDWTHIEEMFGIFRDRLYKDRLQRLEEEEQSLVASVPSHPEYLNMKQCLDDRLEQKLREINKELEYRVKAHERRTVAQRAQIWGQYYQAVREKRERTLEALNQEWYDIQTARRSAHSLQDCGLLFPKDPAQRIRNAIAYNTEVSTLASIAKYEGFPAGPEMLGASPSELEDDLAAIERAKRARHKPLTQRREEYYASPFDRLGPAGEQFLRETPWANPNHLVHKMYPTSAAPDGQVDNSPGREPQQAVVPPATDVKTGLNATSQSKQQSPSLSNRMSESPELTRTMLNSAHHPMKRVGNLSSVSRGSKTAAA